MNYQKVATPSPDYPLGKTKLGDGFLPTIPKAFGFEAATLNYSSQFYGMKFHYPAFLTFP